MKNEIYKLEALETLLEKEKMATLPHLKIRLGSDVDMTVFRKLKELGYRTSYSHRGQYYTLNKIAQFDAKGLWFYQNVCFSEHGSLLKTVEFFVIHGQAGHNTHELDTLLKVKTKKSLLSKKLV